MAKSKKDDKPSLAEALIAQTMQKAGSMMTPQTKLILGAIAVIGGVIGLYLLYIYLTKGTEEAAKEVARTAGSVVPGFGLSQKFGSWAMSNYTDDEKQVIDKRGRERFGNWWPLIKASNGW